MSLTLSQDEIDAFVGACHGNIEAVKATLTDHPELLEARSSLDESPLGAAAHVGNREIADYLISKGAEMDIRAAAMLGEIEAIQGFIADDHAAARSTGAHGIPAIFHAVAGGSVEALELLLAHGADLVTVTGPESTALNMAAARGHLSMVRWLLDRGAPIDVEDFEGKTALERAGDSGFDEIVNMIVEMQHSPGP